MLITLNVKKIHPNAILPKYACAGDSGLDLFAVEDLSLEPGEFKVIRTGIALELPEHHEGQVRSRSGLAAKFGIAVLNSPGTVDNGYRGEIKIILINHSRQKFIGQAGTFAIAQLVVVPIAFCSVAETEMLSISTDRGDNGFGSTSKFV